MCCTDLTCILLATGTTSPIVAINKCVQKSPPHTTSVEKTTIFKWPKTDSAGSRECTRVSDFDDLTRSLADEMISIYQAQITAVQPWPSTVENFTDHAMQAWGHAKTISKPYVVSAFSLNIPTSKCAIRNKVEELLDEARYIYKAYSLFLSVLYNTWPCWSRTRSRKWGYFLHLLSRHSSTRLGSEAEKMMAWSTLSFLRMKCFCCRPLPLCWLL